MDTMKKLGLVQDAKMVAASKECGKPRKAVDPNQPKRRPGRPRKNPEPQKAGFRSAYRAWNWEIII